jgi:hypothetical protein
VRIAEQAINAFLLGAGLGVGLGAISTYWIVTRERRIISKIRGSIDFLSSYHTLTNAQNRQIQNSEALVSDKEILAYYRLSLECKTLSRKRPDDPINKKRPFTIAAEIIICERVFGLSHLEAIHALRGPNEDRLRSLGQENSN